MPFLSRKSIAIQATCHQSLQLVSNKSIIITDFSVLYGYRGKYLQNRLYNDGLSEKEFPDSNHNVTPSKAIDVAPYPLDWGDTKRWFYLAGVFLGVAKENNINLRWGGDWDSDGDFKDQKWNDLGHFEVIL